MKTIERILKVAYAKLKGWIFRVHPKYWAVSLLTLLLTFAMCAYLYEDSGYTLASGGIPFVVIGVTLLVVCFAKRKFMPYVWYAIPIIVSALLMQILFGWLMPFLNTI